jgi:hypothetical protein
MDMRILVNIDGEETQSVSGGGHSGGGIFISALDQARFGLLFKREAENQLLSEITMRTVHQ